MANRAGALNLGSSIRTKKAPACAGAKWLPYDLRIGPGAGGLFEGS